MLKLLIYFADAVSPTITYLWFTLIPILEVLQILNTEKAF